MMMIQMLVTITMVPFVLSNGMRLDEVDMSGSAHSYHRPSSSTILPFSWRVDHPSLASALDGGARFIGLDIHWSTEGFSVFRFPAYDEGTSCATIGACLHEVAKWRDANAEEGPVIVVLTLAGAWTSPAVELPNADFERAIWSSVWDEVVAAWGERPFVDARSGAWPELEASRGALVVGFRMGMVRGSLPTPPEGSFAVAVGSASDEGAMIVRSEGRSFKGKITYAEAGRGWFYDAALTPTDLALAAAAAVDLDRNGLVTVAEMHAFVKTTSQLSMTLSTIWNTMIECSRGFDVVGTTRRPQDGFVYPVAACALDKISGDYGWTERPSTTAEVRGREAQLRAAGIRVILSN